MKILMVAPEPCFEGRGTPLSILARLRALSELGHEVDLLTYHLGLDIPIPGLVTYRTPNIGFISSVKIGPSLTKVLLDFLLLFKTVRFLLKRRYDLLHTHEEASFFGVVLAKAFRVPHLYDMHSSLAEHFRYTWLRLLTRIFDWIERRVINSSDAVITICPALLEHVKQINGHVPQVMIENVAGEVNPTTIPDGNLKVFRSAYPRLHGHRIVLYAGTFEPYQGIDLLVASAERVVRRHANVMFVLVGGNPKQVRSYEEQVNELGLSSHFHFTGARPSEEVQMLVRRSEVLVSPRTHGTNTPLKIYSYLQSGKPIVATNLYTHTQVLNSDTAVLVEPNAGSLGEGILSVLEDAQLATSLSVNSRRLFETNYSFRAFVQLTEQALKMALG